ncbi:hypothetical protein DL95DRAFT_398174 [Leptodontidium sp. 2 PMI_412]|nr:hypothetical protein DL95DRAFT_398174 [Leptodontidium sp. 2 PMI_412]
MQRVDGDKSKPVKYQSYVNDLCHAMICFFDCKFYSITTYSTLELAFYGIAENTVAAAMSFEMTYNLIAEWARPYKGFQCVGATGRVLGDGCTQVIPSRARD